MSAGPIKAQRDAWTPLVVSTPDASRVCKSMPAGRGYCGRPGKATTASWDDVTCADCFAAARADGMEIE